MPLFQARRPGDRGVSTINRGLKLRFDDPRFPRTPRGSKKEANEGLNSTIEVPLDILELLRARKKAWKIPELTELLNLGRRTLYEEVEAERLPAWRFGTAIRINPSDAVIWAEARMTRVVYRAA